MVKTLFQLGDEIYKVASPYIKKYITQQGGKPVTKIAADRINKNPSTVTNVNQIKPKGRANLKPSTKVVKPKSGVTSQQRSALSDMGGQTVKLSKPTGGAGRANLKPKAPSMKPTTPSMKPKSPSMKPQRPSMKPKPRVVKPSVASPKPNTSAPKPRPKITTQPPKKSTKPMTPGRAARIGGTAAIITGATLLGNKGQKKSGAGTSTVTGPKSRPSRNAPNYGMSKPKAKPSEGKDPRGNQIKATPGKMIMPKKFDGGYNSKTQKLVNITVDGKKATYEIPKGMTTKQAKSLLTSTTKKKAGGTPGKYKGFSKLPEKVQKKMSSTLASKYEEGGSIKMKPAPMPKPKRKKKPGYTAKPAPMPKPNLKKKPGYKLKPAPMPKVKPKTKRMADNPKLKMMLKSGGSINSSIVARQVKGFGAARKPKK